MKTGIEGINLIKQFEGCKLNAYKCPAGIPTIGYGNTFYKDGTKIKIGDKITQAKADEMLLEILPMYEGIVRRSVKASLTQNQFDALVSFVYNTGGSQTLFKMISEKQPIDAIVTWWKTHYIMAAGKTLPGLVKRRNAEAELFKK